MNKKLLALFMVCLLPLVLLAKTQGQKEGMARGMQIVVQKAVLKSGWSICKVYADTSETKTK